MKKKLLAFGMAVLMLTGCGSSSGTIRFGAAGLGGTYHMFSDAFAEIIESESADCSIEVKTTAGSAANVRLLSDGYVQMAIAQADIINDAYYGVGMFENDKKYQGYSAVGGLYTEACQIVVRADSDIRSVEDLQGKTVSVGEEESGTEKNAEQILAAYGLSERLVTEVNLDYTDAVEQLKKKEIDAMFCTAGAYTTVIGELAKQCEIRFIDLDEKGIEYKDYGCDSLASVDYPVYAKKVAHAILDGECEKGILICGTGIGISITANKIKGIRAAVCTDCFTAEATRLHNDANILALGGRVVGPGLAVKIVDTFLNTPFSNDERHIRRINQIETE